MFRKFSQWFDLGPSSKISNDKGKKDQQCAFEGCAAEGQYKAPKSRQHLEQGIDDWHWFCLIHVRDYNARWNYYMNMSETEIEQERRADVTWQRPTWPLGGHPHATKGYNLNIKDPFDLFTDGFSSLGVPLHPKFPPQSPQGKALLLFGLSFPFTQSTLQKSYRDLVKKHHPDINGGCLKAQEELKRINEAYEILKTIG